VKPASQIGLCGPRNDPMASRYRRMRGSISYKQPSTKRGEAQASCGSWVRATLAAW
jgi:hypothetical protein